MTDNLLPCPFCGERAHMHAVNGPYCGNFECALHLVSGFTLDAWNKRAWQAARTVPVEVFDSHCNYASFAGRVCNKCGRIHDGGKSVAVVGHGMLEKFKLWRDERIGRQTEGIDLREGEGQGGRAEM